MDKRLEELSKELKRQFLRNRRKLKDESIKNSQQK